MAKASTHTPGPWTLEPVETAGWGLRWNVSAPDTVKTLRCDGKAMKRPRIIKNNVSLGLMIGAIGSYADARLIAAAPDLLKALKDFEIRVCHGCEGSGHEPERCGDACHRCGGAGETIHGGWPADVRAAIAKAEKVKAVEG